MMRLRLTRQADRDIESILDQTLSEFGPRQVRRYAALISRAFDLIVADPDRTSAQRREEIGAGVRSFHIAAASPRRSAAAHLVYFQKRPMTGGAEDVVVLRVLHERMESRRRLIEAIESDQKK